MLSLDSIAIRRHHLTCLSSVPFLSCSTSKHMQHAITLLCSSQSCNPVPRRGHRFTLYAMFPPFLFMSLHVKATKYRRTRSGFDFSPVRGIKFVCQWQLLMGRIKWYGVKATLPFRSYAYNLHKLKKEMSHSDHNQKVPMWQSRMRYFFQLTVVVFPKHNRQVYKKSIELLSS